MFIVLPMPFLGPSPDVVVNATLSFFGCIYYHIDFSSLLELYTCWILSWGRGLSSGVCHSPFLLVICCTSACPSYIETLLHGDPPWLCLIPSPIAPCFGWSNFLLVESPWHLIHIFQILDPFQYKHCVEPYIDHWSPVCLGIILDTST